MLNTPGLKAGEEIDLERFSLFPIRVACWNRLVFACLDPGAPDLLDWLGDIVQIAARFPSNNTMDYQGEILKTGALNWKAYADNSCEGYHVGMVHRNLGESMGREKVDIQAYPKGEFVGFDVSYNPRRGDQTRAGRGFWIYKFPGLLLHFSEYSCNVESVITSAWCTGIWANRWGAR
ncbi:MAG: SRPBCC family protein, partial [Gammaproteobacteria bacterium]